MFDWLVERKAWGAGVDLFCGALFWAGAFDSGPAALERKERLAKKLRGEREQLLDPILDAYQASVKAGEPMTRTRFLAVFGPALFYVAMVVLKEWHGSAVSGTLAAVLVPCLIPLLQWLQASLGVAKLEVRERVLLAEQGVLDRQIVVRKVERDILMKRLASGTYAASGDDVGL